MKNYFYFSQGQKIGIIVLLTIVVGLIIVNETLPYFFEKSEIDAQQFMAEVAIFKQSLQEKEAKKQFQYIAEKKLNFFNPNTLDSAGFVALGIRPKIAQNILKYRNKGGKFKTPQDFSKVYGISEQQFNELLPYINIPKQENAQKDFAEKREIAKPTQTLIVELNTADTTELKKIKGIGSVFAQRIVKYRELLGGYIKKEQLMEVYGLTSERFQSIEKFIIVDAQHVKKIQVNRASVERLKSHKYLNFYAAKAIFEQRQKMGKLSSIDDLKGLKDLPHETLEKIVHYLCFE